MAIYFRKAKPSLADYAAGALQGISSGMNRATERKEKSLAEIKALSDIQKSIQEADDANMARQMVMGTYQPQGTGQPTQPSIQIPQNPGGGVNFINPASQQPPVGQLAGNAPTATLPRRPIAKTIKFGGQEFVNPDYQEYELAQKKSEEEQKPLSDTAASKLSAAQQSLGNIQTVREMATPEKFGNLKSGFSKIRVANRLGITNPESITGAAIRSIPVIGALSKWGVKTTDEQKAFENNLSTLVEGQLRARTGAAAPQQEVDREVSRILSSDDSLNSFLSKISNAEKFVLGISEGIRPGSTKKFGLPQRKSKYEVVSVD